MIHHGDCLAILPTLDAESIDAIVTDPPYGLSFMGKAWDDLSRIPAPDGPQWGGYGWHGSGATPPAVMQAWHMAWAVEAYRVAKPGAYLLAFGGTRTVHRMTCAIEDAGWEIRDTLVWAYASGFPKSHNLTGDRQGWGTALKPAWEPIVMARKPLRGTVARNVAEYGTGALNVDGCRIGWASNLDAAAAAAAAGYADSRKRGTARQSLSIGRESRGPENTYEPEAITGRWPANVILTDPIFDGDTPGVVGGGESWPLPAQPFLGVSPETSAFQGIGGAGVAYHDSGTYSRFFLVPKAARSDREPVLGGPGGRVVSVWGGDEDDLTPGKKSTVARRNVHPTVKPTDLMRHLVRLVTPPGGVVLDPFLGSGTTALACEAEGFAWVGIEREAEYVAIAEARLNGTQRGLGLVG